MATLTLAPKYEAFADELVRTARANQIELSDYAEALLRLASEAWFEDTPRLRDARAYSQSQMQDMARAILTVALRESHVSIERRDRVQVSFTALLAGLGDAGKKVLSDVLDKGF